MAGRGAPRYGGGEAARQRRCGRAMGPPCCWSRALPGCRATEAEMRQGRGAAGELRGRRVAGAARCRVVPPRRRRGCETAVLRASYGAAVLLEPRVARLSRHGGGDATKAAALRASYGAAVLPGLAPAAAECRATGRRCYEARRSSQAMGPPCCWASRRRPRSAALRGGDATRLDDQGKLWGRRVARTARCRFAAPRGREGRRVASRATGPPCYRPAWWRPVARRDQNSRRAPNMIQRLLDWRLAGTAVLEMTPKPVVVPVKVMPGLLKLAWLKKL